jgi:hypothetical protein
MYGQDHEINEPGVPALLEKLAMSAAAEWGSDYDGATGRVHLTHPDLHELVLDADVLGSAIQRIFEQVKETPELLFMECTPYREIINFVHSGDPDEIDDAYTIGELLEKCVEIGAERKKVLG